MLFEPACWLLLSVYGALIGAAILSAFKATAFIHIGDQVIASMWLGVLAMATVLLGLSVFVPLTPLVGFGAMTLLAAVALSMPSVRRALPTWISWLTAPVILAVVFLSISAGLNSTRTVEAYDTALYHYQFVRWLSQYGTVRGFALLQERFGSTSSWFALAAPFDFGPFQGRVAGLTGGLAIILCLVHLTLAVFRVLSHRANRADWFLLGGYGLIVPICLVWTFEVSLSPDLPVWILTVVVGWLMLVISDPESGRTPDASSDDSLVIPLLFAAAAFTVKLSAAPVVLVAGIFYWLNSETDWLRRAMFAVAASLMSIPVFLANVVSSACPLYPNLLACLNVPWSVGKAAAKAPAANITDWARWGGPAPDYATRWNWILPWFLHADKLLLLAVCAVCLIGFALARGWRGNRASPYVLALVFIGTAFVFVSAPNPRFGAGYLALCPALFLAEVGPNLGVVRQSQLLGHVKPATAFASLLTTIAVLLLIQGCLRERTLQRSIEAQAIQIPADHDFTRRLVLPPALASTRGDLTYRRNRKVDAPAVLELTTESYNGIEYRRPVDGDLCWGAAIPCLPHPLTGDVHLRDPNHGLRGGFIRSAVAP
jgi:hypothetical protein